MLAVVLLVCASAAQLPRIGDINFYGLRKITADQILTAAGVAPGDPVPVSKGALEDQIADIPEVAAAQLQAVCCEGNRITLFIGIVERGEPQPAFHLPPSGAATLPQDLMDSYNQFRGAALRADLNGTRVEDQRAGHSLSADPAMRGFENGFLTFAASQVELLRDVLRNGSEPEERAAAATVIGYAPNKKDVVEDVLFAVQDFDPDVRANAARTLGAIAVLAQSKPRLGIRISPTGLVELLNSAVLSDRVESTKALLNLTDGGNTAALDLIRERALPALAEMARWKTKSYALPPFLLLGRVAGLPEAQVHQALEGGGRDAAIQKALETAAGKRP